MRSEDPESHSQSSQSSSPARPTSHKRARRGSHSKTPTTEGQVPQYIPKVKSCVACRQQKIRCDVVREPFASCSHCKRLKKECRIDLDFKRVAKRNQLEHLHQQIRDLREQLELAKSSPSASAEDQDTAEPTREITSTPRGQTLETISLSGENVASLFDVFFKFYHQYCPLLDREVGSDIYFDISPILGWTVVLVASRRYIQDGQLLTELTAPYNRLLWATISQMPQTYHNTKALALLCTWPIPMISPISSTNGHEKVGKGLSRLGLGEIDPAFMLSGIMMQIAIQTGIHRSSHAQDFIEQVRNVTQAERDDRQLTWAVCNIVSQSVTISYGHPSRSIYDWNLASTIVAQDHSYFLEIEHRLKIEKFCDKMTRSLYGNSSELVGLVQKDQLSAVLSSLNLELQQLDELSTNFSPSNNLSLLAAKVHFNAFTFFMPSTSSLHIGLISAAYNASILFIQCVIDPDMHSGTFLHHCTNYILRTVLSASCMLLKILNSTQATHLDTTQGRTMFNASILAMRSISLKKNDFPDRAAEAQTRMWRAAGGGLDVQKNALRVPPRDNSDPLVLRIRSRMCVSHVYDCVWRTINMQQTADNPNTIESIVTPVIPAQETRLFQEQPDPISQMEDFDLFNSLDWSFDESLSVTLGPGFE